MPGKPEVEDRRFEGNYPQPWWRGVEEENGSKSSSIDQLSGSVVNNGEANEGAESGVDFNYQTQPRVSPSMSTAGRFGVSGLQSWILELEICVSYAGGQVGKEQQSMKHVLSPKPLTMDKHLGPNSHVELVGHSIVLTSYPYSDAQYAGILTTHGPQTLINPQFYGMHHARMPLPLEMEAEPVYVNAKQYHGILRRRQSRAKAELEKRIVKVRKPYLHESRHLHAMRRARGCGGRFLNTKKSESNNPNVTLEKGKNADSNPSSAIPGSLLTSEHTHTKNENFCSSNYQHDISVFRHAHGGDEGLSHPALEESTLMMQYVSGNSFLAQLLLVKVGEIILFGLPLLCEREYFNLDLLLNAY
ncbi:nuclear transcription factor Y subunit A-1-like isoform X1 [Senna tora]|uniref:Nuclear transcription factor Y subunit n=1 Tax=Senna tora TaxID=362788 RepID=A0A834X1S7_9FABA|nr:nuclear transcription factor Y subunit A-1-like isoform X1 [Senna tora]